jgi:hypothetical protein
MDFHRGILIKKEYGIIIRTPLAEAKQIYFRMTFHLKLKKIR